LISLIKTYFYLFEVAANMSKKRNVRNSSVGKGAGAMTNRLLSAILTGVNRAHPYLPSEDSFMEEHIDTLYRISHISSPSVCTQALMLLFHVVIGVSDSKSKFESNEKRLDENSKKEKDSS